MALIGSSNPDQRVYVRGFHWFRGRSRMAFAAWFKRGADAYISFWRQDGVLTPVQYGAGQMRTPMWAPDLLNVTGPLTDFAMPNQQEWVFGLWVFSASIGVHTFTYRPGHGVVASPYNGRYAGAGNPLQAAPSPANPMLFGGTEGGSEYMRAEDAIAECAVFPFVSPAVVADDMNRVIDLAHDLSAFRRQMAFYLPFRDPGRMSSETVGCGNRYRLEYGAASRAQILPGVHPPVERMRTGTRVFMSSVGFERLRFADGLAAQPTLPNAVLRVGLG